MNRDRLFVNGLMRLAACALMALVGVGAGDAWGQLKTFKVSPISRQYQKYEKEQQYRKAQKSNIEERQLRAKGRLMSVTSGENIAQGFGYVPSLFDRSYLKNINTFQVGNSRSARASQTTLDRQYNLLTQNPTRLTPIKNQGHYGTCWAHATYASLESWVLKNTGMALDYSEKHLAGTHGFDSGFSEGGNADKATAYLTRWSGPIAEAEDPYPNNSYYYTWKADYNAWERAQKEGRSYTRKYEKIDELLPVSPRGTVIGHVQNVRWIPPMKDAKDTSAIKRAVMDYGAVYVDYYINGNDEMPSGDYYFNGETSIDPDRNGWHAVAIVGWDDDYSKDKFYQTPRGNGAWIIKNSWGENSGDNGYWHISYYDMYCGRNEVTVFCNLESVDNYNRVYQYDPLGLVTTYPSGKTKFWGANVFTAEESEELAAVGFYAIVPNTQYSIKIYTGCTAATEETPLIYGDWPISGSCKLTQNGTTDFAGFVTVPLNNVVSVSAGDKFSIVLYIYTPDINVEEESPLAVEYATYGSNGPYSTQATASPGESYFSENGSDWFDARWVDDTLNFCCKAYTKGREVISLRSLLIKGSPVINSGEASKYECLAIYDNEAKIPVTPQWRIIEGSTFAEVSADGTVAAHQVVEDQNVVLQAEYDGVRETMPISIVVEAPEIPQNLNASQGDDASCVSVSWDASKGAKSYGVFRSVTGDSKNKEWQRDVSEPTYSDKTAIPGKTYAYFITAKNAKVSGLSEGVSGWRKLSPPDIKTIKATDNLLDKITVLWGESAGATHYRVYRATEYDGEKTPIGNWQTDRVLDDVPPEAGRPYYYFVVAAVDASGSRPSDYSIVEDGMMAVPVTAEHLEIKGEASIAAGVYADYTADAIYTDGHRVENVSPVAWTLSGDGATVSGNRVTALTVTENKTVTLTASYIEDGKTATGTKEITIAAVKPVAPRNVTAVATGAGGVAVSWHAVAGAASYKVYRTGGTGGSPVQECVGTVAETSFSDSTAIPGVTYSYSVSAVNGAGEGLRSSPAVTVTVPLAVPTGVTATSDRTDGVLVSWHSVNGATHYRVARATSASGAKTELGSWQTGTTFLDTTAPANTPLWYFVRAATDATGANVSGYSSPGAQGMRIPVRTLLSISASGLDRVAASSVAMYSCAAAYDDGTTESVTPQWSVSPTTAATIEANGKLTAKPVTVDTTATVTATYGGKTATKSVKVLAPVSATASVSNMRVTPRWPFSTLVDIDYTLTTTPEGTRALVTLSGHDNDHNVPLAARTLTGDGASGAVAAGERRLTWDIGADYSGFHARSFDVNLEAVPYVIAAPSNVQASQGTSTRGINLSWNAVDEAIGYEIWRAKGSMSLADATLITNVEAVVAYEDTAVVPGEIYFYWFRTVTQYGTGDFASSVSSVFGYRARVVGTVAIDANGGTASVDSLAYTAGNPYGTLPEATRTGYDFAGWWTAATGGEPVREDSLADENITTIYAHWTPCTYVVTLDRQGGSAGTATVTATYESAMPSITVPTWTGHTFGGYYTGTGGSGTQYYTASGASARNWDRTVATTLYAKWNANAYSSPYIVVDLSGGSEASFYPVEALDSAPSGGFNTDEYKTSKLVLRKIPAGTFTMGCQSGEVGYLGTESAPHAVTIGKSFYMAVFEVTQRQYELVMGNRPSLFTNVSYYATRPVEQVAWNDIRGNSSAYDWPNSANVDPLSFVGRLRARTGIDSFDLPTEAKWEHACRAGTTTAFNNGANLASASPEDTTMNSLGRYRYNGGFVNGSSAPNQDCMTVNGSAAVGSYEANAWGLYDMHGNVWEYCLDWYQGRDDFPVSPVTDPAGPVSGTERVRRGGGWYDYAVSCRSAYRYGVAPSYCDGNIGFRLSCSADTNIVQFSVSFDGNGGTAGACSLGYTTGISYDTLPTATRTGYEFAGWWTAASGGTEVTAATSADANVTTLYAHWTPHTYVVTLDPQGGSGGTTSVTATYGSPMPPIAVPTRTDYTFGGYYDATGGGGILYYNTVSGASARNWDKASAATLYAKWTLNTYMVTYKPGYYGSGSQQTATKTHGIALTLKDPIFTRTGYMQIGWATSDGGSKVYDLGASYTSNAAITLYPYWTSNTSEGHERVQLWANGPYWATTNIGADYPYYKGLYFWWGDTVGYSRQNNAWVATNGSSSNFSFDSSNTPTYGKSIAALKNEGWVTANGVLTPSHDAAHVKWGGNWRMPTKQEQSDLINNCDWTWVVKRVNLYTTYYGYEVRGRGGYASYSIFLPCTGYGYGTSLYDSSSYGIYWSSVPNNSYNNCVWYGKSWNLGFNSGGADMNSCDRYDGFPIRPVQGFTE